MLLTIRSPPVSIPCHWMVLAGLAGLAGLVGQVGQAGLAGQAGQAGLVVHTFSEGYSVVYIMDLHLKEVQDCLLDYKITL